jgi:hypothetical protein
MHHLVEVIQAILDLLSLPFTSRRKGEPRSQVDEAQRVALLIIFGAVVVIGSIIWFANFLGRR